MSQKCLGQMNSTNNGTNVFKHVHVYE